MTQSLTLARRTVAAALVAAAITAAPAAAQIYANTADLGGGCGEPAPTLNSTPPVLTGDLTIFLTSCAPNSPVALYVTPPPAGAPFLLGGDCASWVDPTTGFVFTGVTDAFGAYSLTIPVLYLVPFQPGIVCNAQAVIATADPCAVPFAGTIGLLTNGIALTMGDMPPGPQNGLPPVGSFCTYSKGGYHGCGTPGQIFNCNFLTAFPDGFEVGHYDVSGGGGGCGGGSNAAPNGKKFTATNTGRSKLKSYLGGGGTPGAYTTDTIDSSVSSGAGVLGKQIAALKLNVRFNDLGLLGGDGAGFGDLVYVNAGDALNGLTIRQIVEIADNAVAGLGLPAGYTFGLLNCLITNLVVSFDECEMSDWAGEFLFLKRGPSVA